MTKNATNVMATMADVRCTPAFVEAMRRAGAEGFRINSAHVSPEKLLEMVATIRSVDPSLRILMDTKGPEIRTTAPAEPFTLAEGAEVTLRQGTEPSTARLIFSPAPICDMPLQPGHTLLVDDGGCRLEVTAADACSITARVVCGSLIDAAKTIASPDADLPSLPAVSERDRLIISAAHEAGIDMIAHSFVRSADDVRDVRALIDGSGIELYAKIECRQGVDRLDDILAEADALLVARGDLGTQIPLWEIPALQARIAAHCHAAGKPFMIATQMLESMTHAPRPTRAELSDVALGVWQGARWLLLCGETARGEYPVECVDMMRRTVDATVEATANAHFHG